VTDTTTTPHSPGDDSRYYALLQGLFESILITDLNGRIGDANTRAEELFQISGEELRQRTIQDLISGFDDGILHNVDESLITQKHVMIEASGVRRDGTLFPAEIAVNRIVFQDAIQLCFSIRDITARNETANKLEKAQERNPEDGEDQDPSGYPHDLGARDQQPAPVHSQHGGVGPERALCHAPEPHRGGHAGDAAG